MLWLGADGLLLPAGAARLLHLRPPPAPGGGGQPAVERAAGCAAGEGGPSCQPGSEVRLPWPSHVPAGQAARWAMRRKRRWDVRRAPSDPRWTAGQAAASQHIPLHMPMVPGAGGTPCTKPATALPARARLLPFPPEAAPCPAAPAKCAAPAGTRTAPGRAAPSRTCGSPRGGCRRRSHRPAAAWCPRGRSHRTPRRTPVAPRWSCRPASRRPRRSAWVRAWLAVPCAPAAEL